MKRSENRILTTHVGSIIRKRELLDAAHDASTPEKLQHYEQVLEVSVAEVVRKQVEAGIDIVNDGEYGKSSWANYALGRLSGFEPRPGKLHPAL